MCKILFEVANQEDVARSPCRWFISRLMCFMVSNKHQRNKLESDDQSPAHTYLYKHTHTCQHRHLHFSLLQSFCLVVLWSGPGSFIGRLADSIDVSLALADALTEDWT